MSASHSPRLARLLTALWILALLGVFLLPYAQVAWWSFQASTAALFALCILRWRRTAARRAGLPVTWRQILATIVVGLALYALFQLVVTPAVARRAGIVLSPYSPRILVSFVFQTLNEEIVLGYLLVFGLARRTRRPELVVLGAAVFFAGLHVLLYRYGTIGMDLLPLTIGTLVAVGVIRNSAILLAGHVGLAWALHAAWNLSMFAGRWRDEVTGRMLEEPEILDAFLGAPGVALTALVAAVFLFCALVVVDFDAPGTNGSQVDKQARAADRG